MGRVIPQPVHDALARLVDLISPDAGGILIGDRLVASDAPGEELVDAVYDRWYLAPPAAPESTEVVAASLPPVPAAPPLVGLLRAAHAGSARFEEGWVVLEVGARGACVVGRAGVRRVVHPGEYAGLRRPAAPVAPGEEVAVTSRIDVVDAATRWWASRSPSGEPEGPLGRFYLHPTATTVPRVVHMLTRRLVEVPFAWSVKCPSERAGYVRPDAVVLYVPRADAVVARALVLEVVEEVDGGLLAHVPPLTLALGPGAAYADDPGPDSSFGMHCCRALASGVSALAAAGRPGPGAVGVLIESLVAAGVDPAAPWRGAGAKS